LLLNLPKVAEKSNLYVELNGKRKIEELAQQLKNLRKSLRNTKLSIVLTENSN